MYGSSLEIVQYLIDKGIPVDSQENDGRWIIIESLYKTFVIVSDCLISNFSTALMISAENGKLDIVKFLVMEKKASIELTNSEGR